MSQRDIFYKWLFYALLALLYATLQQLLLNPLDLWGGVHPFLLPLLPVMVAILENRQESTFSAIAAGLFCDFLLPGVFPCFYTLAFAGTALLVSLIAGRVIMPGFLCAAVCSVAALVLTDILLILFLASSAGFSSGAALSLMGRELLLTRPLVPVLFLTFRKVRRLIHNT